MLDWGVLHAAHSRRHASVRGVGEACAQAIRTLQDASVDRMRQVAVIESLGAFAAVTASSSLVATTDLVGIPGAGLRVDCYVFPGGENDQARRALRFFCACAFRATRMTAVVCWFYV